MVVTRRRPQTQPPGLLLPRQAQGLGRLHVCSHPGSPVATTAATWEPARAHGAARPHPHPRRDQSGTPRPARGAMLSPQCTPFVPPFRAPGRGGGGGVATPQSRCWGAQPRCCGNGFQANWWRLAPGSGSLAHWRSFPSFLPTGVGWGRGCPLSRSGSGWRYQAKTLGHPQGGPSARRPSSARALFPPGPQPSRYSRAQASSSNSSSCLGASGPANRSPSLEQAAARESRQWQRKPLRVLGWRRGARARARAEPGVRARAANRGTPSHPVLHAAAEAAAKREGVPTCRTQSRHTKV